MVTLYGVLLFLHVLGAILWIGAHSSSIALRLLAVRSGDRARAIATVVDTDRLGLYLIAPGVLLVLGSGFGLVHEGRWGYDHFWIQLGLAGFVVSNDIAGAFYPADITVLVGIVFVMATKATI